MHIFGSMGAYPRRQGGWEGDTPFPLSDKNHDGLRPRGLEKNGLQNKSENMFIE